jgi:tape measure domain-containing protein
MGDNNREVDLVIRAKNEASKALDAVNASLFQLIKAQTDITNTSDKTTSVLAQFGAELGKLSKTVAGMSTFDKITASVTKAADGITRLESSVTKLTSEQEALTEVVVQSGASLAEYQAKTVQLAATLDQQKAATAAAKTNLKELNTEIKDGGNELKTRISNNATFEASLTRQEAALARTQQKHRDLTQAILATDEPSAKLIESFTKIDDKLGSQTARLATSRNNYLDNRQAIAALGVSLAELTQQQDLATANLERAKVAQLDAKNAVQTNTIATREAAKALKEVEGTVDSNATTMARLTEALEKAQAEFVAVQEVAAKSGVALDKIGSVVRQGLLRALADSQIALAKYRAEWETTTSAIAAGMKGRDTSAPLTPELEALIEKAKLSKAAVLEMQVAVQQMRTSVRDAGTDVLKLSAAQQTFSAAMERVRSVTDASEAAQAKLNALTAAVATSASRASPAMNNLAAATRSQAAAAKEAEGAMADLEGRGRQALSWAQRLRGEVVALATAYVGVFAAIQQLSAVIDTFKSVEAAQSRLNVAFGNNPGQTAQEFRFIRAEADRLGISFISLSNEYSKFAVAARGTSLEGEQTRKIFTAMSEAARVNKLSNEQIELSFLALTQMVSKGRVSMEELSRQLGEHLPGAMTIAARSMGMTGAELTKLISTGQLATEDFLPKFAAELEKTFAPSLPKALQTLTTEIGTFQNEVVKAQEKVANGGFVEGLRKGLQSLIDFMRSSDGSAFFNNLGAAAGGLVKILAQIPNYMTPITAVFSLWLGMKILDFGTGLSAGFTKIVTAMKPLPPAMQDTTRSFNAFASVGGVYNATVSTAVPLTTRLQLSLNSLAAGLRTSSGAMTAASISAGILTGALNVLRGVMALMGGLPGLIITGLSLAFTYWMTGTEAATSAVEEHQRQVFALLDVYTQAKDKAGDWAKAVKGVSLGQAEKTLGDLEKAFSGQLIPLAQKLAGTLGGTIFLKQGGLGDAGKVIGQLTDDMVLGKVTVTDYAKALDEMLKDDKVSEEIKNVIRANAGLLQSTADAEQAVAKQGVVVNELGGNASAVAPLIAQLGLSIKKMAEDAGLITATKVIDPFVLLGKQIDILKGKIPSLKDEMKRLEDLKELDEILKTANLIEGLDKSSDKYREFLTLVQTAQNDINEQFKKKEFGEITKLLTSEGSGVDMSSKLIKQFEGFQPTAKFDVNAFRAGFGSDTITLADGSIQKITEGMKVNVEDANRDLVRRIGEFQGTVKGQIGSDRFDSFNVQQQAALTSVAYNYGSLPERIVGAVRSGSSEEIAKSIRALGTDNAGVNAGRRNQEAAIFQQGPNFNPEGMAKVYETMLETSKKFHDSLMGNLEVQQMTAESAKRHTLDQAISLAVTKEENAAKKAGTELTSAERTLIVQSTTEAQKKKQAEWDIADAKKAQVKGEQDIATLQQLRRDILQQMTFAQKQGDLVAYDQLQIQLKSVSAQLDTALKKMIAFWEASGNSPKAQAAIAQLKNIQNSLVKVGEQGILTFQNVGKELGGGMVTGMDNWLAKIRETGNVFGSLKEAFQNFASDFLLKIAQMIAKQALFNAMKALFSGTTGATGAVGQGVLAAIGGVAHSGGVVGQSIGSRAVSPSWFNNAVRYHTGGIAGLKSDEIPTILQKGETIRTVEQEKALAEKQALAAASAGAGGAGGSNVKIVNAIDAGSFVSAGVEDIQGQRAIINFMRANKSSVRGALGV